MDCVQFFTTMHSNTNLWPLKSTEHAVHQWIHVTWAFCHRTAFEWDIFKNFTIQHFWMESICMRSQKRIHRIVRLVRPNGVSLIILNYCIFIYREKNIFLFEFKSDYFIWNLKKNCWTKKYCFFFSDLLWQKVQANLDFEIITHHWTKIDCDLKFTCIHKIGIILNWRVWFFLVEKIISSEFI